LAWAEDKTKVEQEVATYLKVRVQLIDCFASLIHVS
jgi:hypothetical protein